MNEGVSTTMDIARRQTRIALTAAIGNEKHAVWARRHNLMPTTVSDCMRGSDISVKRLNDIQAALGMPLTRIEKVTIDHDRERVVTRTKPRNKVTFAIRLSPEEAEELRSTLRSAGYSSLNDWWHENWPL